MRRRKTAETVAAEVYRAVVDNTESLEKQHFGEDLAYLLGAILTGTWCSWPQDRPILVLLTGALGLQHEFWSYIEIER
jgi:hypothetical protein